jgi:hypothetical protein
MRTLIKILTAILKPLFSLLGKIRATVIDRALRLRARLRFHSLGEAIQEADDNKKDTGRKSMVLFNHHTGKYESIEKKLLKNAKKRHKIKGQPKQTEFRKSRKRNVKPGRFTDTRIKSLEKRAPYVTQ